MNNNSLVGIESRLHKLECKFRNFKIASFLLPIGLAAVVISNADSVARGGAQLLNNQPIEIINTVPIDTRNPRIRMLKRNAQFGTLVVDKLIIKDDAGRKTLLQLGRNTIKLPDGGEGEVDAQSGVIILANSKDINRNAILTSEYIKVKSKSGSKNNVSINHRGIVVKEGSARSEFYSAGMSVSQNNKTLVRISALKSGRSAISLKSAGKVNDFQIVVTNQGAKMTIFSAQARTILGTVKAGVGLQIENTAKNTSLSATIAKDSTPAIILKSK